HLLRGHEVALVTELRRDGLELVVGERFLVRLLGFGDERGVLLRALHGGVPLAPHHRREAYVLPAVFVIGQLERGLSEEVFHVRVVDRVLSRNRALIVGPGLARRQDVSPLTNVIALRGVNSLDTLFPTKR